MMRIGAGTCICVPRVDAPPPAPPCAAGREERRRGDGPPQGASAPGWSVSISSDPWMTRDMRMATMAIREITVR